mgnify:CR=1 FL=1
MRKVSSVSEPGGLAKKVSAAFAPGGALADALPSFEPRDSQRSMAVAVAEVFESDGVLLVEAGTGTGKTLAYLVPAILSGHRVLLSTGTKQLQDQIYNKDLPTLRDVLQVRFTATYMKGRGNYLCLHRLDAFHAGEALLSPADRGHFASIKKWAEQTRTGDRTEIEGLPDNLPFWGNISATSENCIGTECPQYDDCFVTQMRRQAAESDLVIVNHHLLCADAAVRQSDYGEVIPACHYAVIDEAHQLEDVATQYFGVSISPRRFERLTRDARRYIDRELEHTPEEAKPVRAVIDLAERYAEVFFGAARMHLSSIDRARIDPNMLAPLAESGHRLASTLRRLDAPLAHITERSEDLRSLGRRASELANHLDFVLEAADPDFVYFLERRGQGLFLRASPVDVSAIIRELLLDRMRATILTSATLAVDGSFDYQRVRLGIRDAIEIRLEPEFDYAKQTVLYLPEEMPEPRASNFTQAAATEIAGLLEATRGRAFVLFTSHANLREVHRLITDSVAFPLLVQGTAPRSVLLRKFKATPNAVLLATSSFWQGVDVSGDTLSCVIIDKLPFATPDDPITAARIQAITEGGGNPFAEYQVPLAILSLLQGIGRLIRHRKDRGVLSILDPRVLTKSYGQRFLASLPPAPIVRGMKDVRKFLDLQGM